MGNKVNFLKTKIRIMRKNLDDFQNFIENSEGNFLEGENYKNLRALEFRFNKSILAAKRNGIDVSDYESFYQELSNKLEEKNEQYIRLSRLSILENYSENKLKRKSIEGPRNYRVPLIHDPRRL